MYSIYVVENTSWDDAVAHCTQRNGSLLSVKSGHVWTTLHRALLYLFNRVDITYIGLSKSTQNGEVSVIICLYIYRTIKQLKRL